MHTLYYVYKLVFPLRSLLLHSAERRHCRCIFTNDLRSYYNTPCYSYKAKFMHNKMKFSSVNTSHAHIRVLPRTYGWSG